MKKIIPVAMTIAGSDSGGGAGIQADIKTMHSIGVFPAVAITSVTAQNTTGVTGRYDITPEMVGRQIAAVFDDMPVSAVKTGMLASSKIIETVSDIFEKTGIRDIVVDPVMLSKSGDALLDEEALTLFKNRFLRLARVLTPNIPEAEKLSDVSIECEDDIREAAVRIIEYGPEFVLVKGGHGSGDSSVDFLYDGKDFLPVKGKRVNTKNTHGTGCVLSAAITAYIAKGFEVKDAVLNAKIFIEKAISESLDIGRGYGPVNPQPISAMENPEIQEED